MILFVCSGNTCRSPMAERLFPGSVSAGTHATPGTPMTPHAAQVVRELGGDPEGFASRRLDAALLREAEWVFTMTAAHREWARRLLPEAAGRIETLVVGADVADPYGQGLDVYRDTARQIRQALLSLRSRL